MSDQGILKTGNESAGSEFQVVAVGCHAVARCVFADDCSRKRDVGCHAGFSSSVFRKTGI